MSQPDRPRLRSRLRPRVLLSSYLALALAVGSAAAGCGKKGPPRPPILRVPQRATEFSARRLASQVFLRFTIPTANSDASRPADIDWVEVYGYTGTPPSNDDLTKRGTLVARVQVRPPPPPPPKDGDRRAPPPPPPSGPGLDQGAVALVSETLTPALFVPVPSDPKQKLPRPVPVPEAVIARPLGDSIVAPTPTRVYLAMGISHRGRKGLASARATVPLLPPPPAPAIPVITYTPDVLTIAWTPPPGARRPVQDLSIRGPILQSRPFFPNTGSTYNVYEAPTVTATDKAPPAPSLPIVTPLNERPIDASSFPIKGVTFGVERCFVVRTINSFGNLRVESEGSPAACVTPRDTFPPAAPSSLAAIASEGAISLIWVANSESDLAGYLILRGEAPGATLQRLTPTPIRETTYRDTAVRAGVRYVYVVVAVDTATPANLSQRSNRVEDTAR